MTIAIAFDIGGTKVSAAYIVGEEIICKAKLDYKRETILEDISSLFFSLTANRPSPIRVGISCAGLVDVPSGTIRFAGNLGMQDYPLGQLVSKKLGLEVIVDNDARCATWGEFVRADGRLGDNVAGLILGTGVGGGLIVNSRLLVGKNSFAGEIGHLPVTNSLKQCACGKAGCLESVAGGRAFEQDFELATGIKKSAKEISDLAAAGDHQALSAFDRVGEAVGEVIAQLDTAFDLDAVVVGGGFGKTLVYWENSALNRYNEVLLGSKYRTPLKVFSSRLDDDAQLIGAVAPRG